MSHAAQHVSNHTQQTSGGKGPVSSGIVSSPTLELRVQSLHALFLAYTGIMGPVCSCKVSSPSLELRVQSNSIHAMFLALHWM